MADRVVTVVLDDPRRVLPPFDAPTPWWPDVEPVVAEVRRRHGLDIVVLRLLDGAEPDVPPVTYLAEVKAGDASAVGAPWPGELPDDPKRLPYARPGGPAADLRWAEQHVLVTDAPVQVKTWNLSSIWRLPTADGTVWLKHVPPFFAHEPLVIAALGEDAPLPRLVAGEPGRMLLADVPGEDCYDADHPQLAAMVDALVTLQVGTIDRVDELLALGATDWRPPALTALAADVVARDAPPEHRDLLVAFVAGLDDRFAALADCGLPDVLVHGDFHPGNVRWSGGGPILLDWGDCGLGHPLLDLPAFLTRVGDHAEELRDQWLARWTAEVPSSEATRAAELVEPVAAIRQAVVYRSFLDGIEASEQAYHRNDVPLWLAEVARILRRPGPGAAALGR